MMILDCALKSAIVYPPTSGPPEVLLACVMGISYPSCLNQNSLLPFPTLSSSCFNCSLHPLGDRSFTVLESHPGLDYSFWPVPIFSLGDVCLQKRSLIYLCISDSAVELIQMIALALLLFLTQGPLLGQPRYSIPPICFCPWLRAQWGYLLKDKSNSVEFLAQMPSRAAFHE